MPDLTSSLVWDIFRWVAMGLGFVSMGMALRIGYYYLPHVGKTRSNGSSLLPLHVVLISLAWATLCGSFMVEISTHLGERLTWRAPVGLFIGALACYALTILSVHLSKHHAIWEERPERKGREGAT